MSTIFKHENQPFPPFLSDNGKLRLSKSLIFELNISEDDQPEPPSGFDVSVPTANIATFDEYADLVFIPCLIKQLKKCCRLDLVWDTYITNSIGLNQRKAKSGH